MMEPAPKTKFINLNGRFWSFTFYLLFFAGVAPLFSFLVLYYTGQGLSGSQIGVLMGIGPLIGLFAGPLWGGLADAIHRHRLILAVAMIGNMLAIFCFTFAHTFWEFFLLAVLQSLFGGPIIPLVDHATMSMLGDQKEQYGLIRMGGTVGYLLAAMSMGAVVNIYGLQWIFWFYCSTLLFALLTIRNMHFSHQPSEESFLSGVWQLLSDRKWILFLFIIFVAGGGNSTINSYLFLYLDRIGTDNLWKGWALSIATLAELPALYFANHFLKRFKSRGLLVAGLIGTAIRCMLYGAISVPWMALVVQLLQAVSFPLLLVAGVSYADENAPAGLGATAQGIFNSAFMGFGFAAGGFFGGMLIDYIGVQQMYFVFGIATLLAALVFGLLQRRELLPQPA